MGAATGANPPPLGIAAVKEQISHGEAMRGAAERQTYNDVSDTRSPSGASVITDRPGVCNPNIAALKISDRVP